MRRAKQLEGNSGMARLCCLIVMSGLYCTLYYCVWMGFNSSKQTLITCEKISYSRCLFPHLKSTACKTQLYQTTAPEESLFAATLLELPPLVFKMHKSMFLLRDQKTPLGFSHSVVYYSVLMGFNSYELKVTPSEKISYSICLFPHLKNSI